MALRPAKRDSTRFWRGSCSAVCQVSWNGDAFKVELRSLQNRVEVHLSNARTRWGKPCVASRSRPQATLHTRSRSCQGGQCSEDHHRRGTHQVALHVTPPFQHTACCTHCTTAQHKPDNNTRITTQSTLPVNSGVMSSAVILWVQAFPRGRRGGGLAQVAEIGGRWLFWVEVATRGDWPEPCGRTQGATVASDPAPSRGPAREPPHHGATPGQRECPPTVVCASKGARPPGGGDESPTDSATHLIWQEREEGAAAALVGTGCVPSPVRTRKRR